MAKSKLYWRIPMGRLRKSVVDRIVRLRKQGYTQVEVAEKAGIHLKTVQKHDPLRRSRKTEHEELTTGVPVKGLESDIKALEEWVYSLWWTIRHELRANLLCPKCLEGVLDDPDGPFVCQKCHYKMKSAGDL
jgi:ribosomal protein S27AE